MRTAISLRKSPIGLRKRPWMYPPKSPIQISKKATRNWVCSYNEYTIYTSNKCSQKALIVSAEEPDRALLRIRSGPYLQKSHMSTKEPYVLWIWCMYIWLFCTYPQKSHMYIWLFWVCNYNACALTKEPSKSSPKSPIYFRHRPTCDECALTMHAHYYTSTHEPHKCSQKSPKRIYKRARYISAKKEPYVMNVQLECIHYIHTQSVFLLFTHLIKIWRCIWFTSENTID